MSRLDHLTVNIHACIYADGNVCKFLLIQLEFAVGKKCQKLSIEQFVKLFNSGNFKNSEVIKNKTSSNYYMIFLILVQA